MNNKAVYVGLTSIIVGVFVSYILFGIHTSNYNSDSHDTLLKYKSQVCIYKTPWLGEGYGERKLVECSHNLLYNNGANMTRDILGQGGTVGAIVNISLCNATAGCATPVAGASEAFTAYTTCGLAAGTAGAYAVVPTSAGNWSISKTFTSTCDNVLVNATRLSNNTAGVFAGNTFNLVTLMTSDQLTVNWTIMVS